MKTIFFTLGFFSLILSNINISAPTVDEAEDYARRSEIRFCEARGYDPDNMTEDQINEFLNCWRGSIEEEAAMNNDND